MIGISKLYCGTVEAADPLRYGRRSAQLPSHLLQFSADKKPVVVWNCTQRCNLRCRHCYAACTSAGRADELTTDEARALIDDLGAFGCPVLLVSGGEPMLRDDLGELVAHARAAGLRAVISTNGTLITPGKADELARMGLSYVGISLDGLPEANDRFRGLPGAFDLALGGIRNCRAAGLKVGLRLTITRANAGDIPAIFDLIEQERIPRICFYHLAYSGRGDAIRQDALPHDQTRRTLDLIMDRTADLHRRGHATEVLTVDNHADGPYLYLRLLREAPARAAQVLQLLRMNGGNSTGVGIGCVSWDGNVLPDQFWRQHTLGNVRQRKFSEIWTDGAPGLLANLRRRKELLTGRCARCRWLDICNGNFRSRAQAATGNLWGDDPACYLTDAEIAPDET